MKKRDLAKDLIELEEYEDFWQQARDKVLLSKDIKGPVLDIGCGTGVITKPLIDRGLDVFSIDVDIKSCEKCKKINPKTYCLDFLKLNENDFPKFNTIIMADSLEHIQEDNATLKKAAKIINPQGILLISVPYHNFLWTKNDFVRHHFRRYSRWELKEKLRNAGFEFVKIKFWNFLSVGPILAAKYLKFRLPHENISKSILNKILKYYLIYFENYLPLPVGSELICIARKRDG